MNYLIDTHYLLWALIEPTKIDKKAVKILEDEEHVKYVSSVSHWEISLKYALGKLELRGTTPDEILETSIECGFELLSLSASDAASYYQLPKLNNHKDPFDRMLVWQCIQNDFTLLSADGRLSGYRKSGLKLV